MSHLGLLGCVCIFSYSKMVGSPWKGSTKEKLRGAHSSLLTSSSRKGSWGPKPQHPACGDWALFFFCSFSFWF